MLSSIDLRPTQFEFLQAIAFELTQISGVVAVVLGGSYARGSARPDSDLDIGIYYCEKSEPKVEKVRDCAKRFSLPDRPPIVTDFYDWGPWVNGGAWIHSPVGRVDFLYRNADQVQRVIYEVHQGIYHHDFHQQPTFGFTSVIYLGETKCCVPVFDQQHLISQLKRQVQIYPALLQHRLINNSLWQVEFTLLHAHRFAAQADIFNGTGCLARIAFFLLQALFALNGEYYFGDKGAVEATDRFGKQPAKFSVRLQRALASPLAESVQLESAVHILEGLWHEVVDLSGGNYTPKFGLAGRRQEAKGRRQK
jgi:Nucleotidyltransferase domain